ncbi:MAG TPA: AarF/ABC1/UbiB kinase family protein [Acetobacteraceae bacterium]|nr:AarF/ABC1/UbiB kinase family protein [Acetobacteraceae bacterium]
MIFIRARWDAHGPRTGHNGGVADIPQRRARTAKLASLPLGVAGRATVGLGKRMSGRSSEEVTRELQARTAQQLFTVLGELKGGAMKLGQALSVFEAALPEESAAPYREALTKLQDAAPPMPAATVRRVLDEQFGRRWPQRFRSFDETPAAAASIGQVHRAVWSDGREVAVKLQYPGAAEALLADFTQLSRLAWLFARFSPGLEVKPLLAELRERVLEEVDYALEADAQRRFAAEFADDADIAIPRVVASAPKALVTEWLDGTPLSKIISDGTTEQRDRAGSLLALLHYCAPARAKLLHADPHPGNFRLCPDGRLGVVDFGAVARLPEGSPAPLGRLTRYALDGDGEAVMRVLREQHFLRRDVDVTAAQVMDYLGPILEPLRAPTFTFTREWMRGQATRLGDPRREEARVGRSFNLPPSYLLIHRVTLGSIGVLCQLGATAPFRALAERWQAGFAK